MIPEELSHILSSNPDQVHGQICFTGTRVPVYIFMDYIGSGLGISEFLINYSNVPRDDAEAVLRHLERNDGSLRF